MLLVRFLGKEFESNNQAARLWPFLTRAVSIIILKMASLLFIRHSVAFELGLHCLHMHMSVWSGFQSKMLIARQKEVLLILRKWISTNNDTFINRLWEWLHGWQYIGHVIKHRTERTKMESRMILLQFITNLLHSISIVGDHLYGRTHWKQSASLILVRTWSPYAVGFRSNPDPL